MVLFNEVFYSTQNHVHKHRFDIQQWKIGEKIANQKKCNKSPRNKLVKLLKINSETCKMIDISFDKNSQKIRSTVGEIRTKTE